MNKHKWYNEIIAYAEGRDIECKDIDSNVWSNSCNPFFYNPYFEFRVKPEPKTDVIKYVNYAGDGYFSKIDANNKMTFSCIGQIKTIVCGKTGKLKSVEIVNYEEN